MRRPDLQICLSQKTLILFLGQIPKIIATRPVVLCPNCHAMYDSGRIDRAAIIAYKKKLLFLNEVYSRFELDVLDHLKTHKRALIPGELLVKRLLEEKIVRARENFDPSGFGDGEDILGIFSVVLTEKQMLDDWSKVDESLTHDRL